MTPDGFRAWVRGASPGDQIIYHQGLNLTASPETKELRDAAREAYTEGTVTLVQARVLPKQGLNKRTVGIFAYIARRKAS